VLDATRRELALERLAEGDAIAVRLAEGGVDARVTGVRMPARGPGAD